MKPLEQMQAEADQAISKAKVQTEAEMRATKSPWPESSGELIATINGLVDRPHDYGTCVYAASLAGVAAMNYVATKLGMTGFQMSCADMDVVRRTRLIEGPFMILNLSDALYPQCDLMGKVRDAIRDAGPWLAEKAAERLKDTEHAHPDVIAHWQRLVQAKA